MACVLAKSEYIEQSGLIAAIEQAADCIIITDTNGKIQYANRAFTAMTGYTTEEVFGQSSRIFKSGSQPFAFYQGLWETIRSGRVWHGELVNRRKDGTLYDEDLRITPVRGANGEIASYIAVKRDITERRAEENAKRRLAAIVESSEDAIISTTPTGVIVTWNRGAEAVFGYLAHEAIGKNVSMLIAPARLSDLAYFNGQIAQGLTVTQYESLCRRKDGREFDVSVTGSPITNSAGEVVALSAVLRDTSERRAAERARDLLASTVESSADAILSTSLDGTICSWNQGAAAMFGYSGQEVAGKSAAILAPPGRGEEVRRHLATIARGYAVDSFDTVLQTRDGGDIPVSLSISPIRNPAGEVIGVAGIARDIRERLAAEQKLRLGEELFREGFQHAPFGMAVVSMDGRFLQVNGALCRMLGYSQEELANTPWTVLVHPEDLLAARQNMERLVESPGGLAIAERRYLHRKGNVVLTNLKVSLIRDSESRPQHFVAHVEDITERKRAEEALRESEARFRIMADSCPAVMWMTDADGGIQFINRAYRELIGTTYEQSKGDGWQLALHPEDAPEYLGAFQRAVKEHTALNAEVRARRADGEWGWFATAAEPRFSAEGEYLGHVGLSPDITERKRLEEEVRMIASVVEASTDLVGFSSMDGEVLFVNQAGRRFVGLDPDQPMKGTQTVEYVADDDRHHFLNTALSSVMRDGQWEGETRFKNSVTAAVTPMWQSVFCILDPKTKRPIALATICRDLSERKREEEQVRAALHAAEASEASLRETESSLRTAKEGAEASNRAKSCFLANMSHEIRTPMNGVIGMLQLLCETDLTAEQLRYATVAQSSGRDLLSLIDGILDLSKIEARKIVLENTSFNLRDAVGDIAQIMQVQANAKGLSMHSSVSPAIPLLLRGDAHRLRQVLTNLVANAIKFTERGEVRLDAALESRCDHTATVGFTITDTGIGIHPGQVGELFSPFTQADCSTTRRYGGTGLGLTISKQLVELMGGAIGVNSREGRGSTFKFTAVFELAPASEQPAAFERGDRRSGTWTKTTHSQRTARILVAEDNVTNQKVVLAQLQKLGFQASAVCTGADATEAVQQGSYDLVLMDCQMPVMDGFEATRLIRRSTCPNIPIIAVTADAMSEDRNRCLSAGMSDYLAKPLELQSLEDTLAKWLPRSNAADAAQTPGQPARERARALFDGDDLLRRLIGDRPLARQILRGFLDDAPSVLNNLGKHLDEADAPGVRLHAHNLGGAAATVSADGLHALALALEQASTSGQMDHCRKLLPQVIEEFQQLKRTLDRTGWV